MATNEDKAVAATTAPEPRQLTKLQSELMRAQAIAHRVHEINNRLSITGDRLAPINSDAKVPEELEQPDGDLPHLSWLLNDIENTLITIEENLERVEGLV